mmetsp:Transcript_16338/g.39891  ORF Transcript_16338/g.39891 Transcript_16338/m.39891 type:complete len:92 (-) Transcript_16338:94-369(-)
MVWVGVLLRGYCYLAGVSSDATMDEIFLNWTASSVKVNISWNPISYYLPTQQPLNRPHLVFARKLLEHLTDKAIGHMVFVYDLASANVPNS